MDTFQLLLNLIRYEVCQTTDFPSISKEDREQILPVVDLANQFGVVHLAVNALKGNGIEQHSREVETQVAQMSIQYIQQDYALNQIRKTFSENSIPFIPLKGALLRRYYPEEWMRSSCDIDILIKNEDINSASRILTEQMGYSETGKSFHDVSFVQGFVHVELHFDLVEEGRANNAKTILDHVWDYSQTAQNSSEFAMTDEMFYFYHIAHMAKHIEHGGCGIKPFLDIWVLNHRISFDKEKRNSLLERGNLLQFAEAAERLSEVWFSDAVPDETSNMLQEYILAGGIYGSVENSALVTNAKSGGKNTYLIKAVFLPYANMVLIFPWLQNRKWLLPAAWTIRIFKAAFKKNARSTFKSGIDLGRNSDNSKNNKARELLEKLGIN